MHSVKVRRRGASADQAATVIRQGLGSSYQVTPNGERELDVRKGTFVRARVDMRVVAWGVIAVLFAICRFSWVPRQG
jgi:hypothetical protein